MAQQPQQQPNRMETQSHQKPAARLLEVDLSNMLSDTVGAQGIASGDLARCRPDLQRVYGEVAAKAEGGIDAPYAPLNLGTAMTPHLPDIERMAATLRQFSDVVVIGIGGSSLGAKAVWHMLRATLPPTPRLHFVENVDPFDLDQLLAALEARNTAVVCISKSGGTIETVVQYLVIRAWLANKLGPQATHHQWIVTDPRHGWLRELAERERLPALPVPPHVGGRYSVLSAVGLLPLAVIGVDVRALLDGAAANAARCQSDDIEENPALKMAAFYYLLDTEKQKRVSVMMPYANRLRLFVDWYCQLWAESLGKHRDGADPAGTLPVRAMGAVDQHSQLQMYLESRHDKMFTFIELATWEHAFEIPLNERESAKFPYLKDKTLADVIHAEFRATRQIVTETQHPNMTITLPALNAHVLGQLIDLYQRTTIYTAHLYGINPIDQPAVEKGKKIAVEYLSRMKK